MTRDDEDDVTQISNLQPPIITAPVSLPRPPATAESHLQLRRSSAKPNPKILALILKALVMIFVVSLFFIFVGIAAIFLLHICFAGGALHRRHRRHRHFVISPISDSDQQNPNLGLSMEDLNKLPLFIFSQIEESQTCGECVELHRKHLDELHEAFEMEKI
ncbi:hypothetical protein RJ641_027760 [Dillenia turbinata]|uniref:Transmembrane protein n=1 Tax=Dillenia turbinata TaxID=194707 RepID=A0AAN8VWU6_9MAGN